MTKAQRLLHQAREAARTAQTWADFSNFLYDPFTGLITTAYPSRAERQKFIQTPEYREIQGLLEKVREETGLVEGATPTKSGRFVVRLPQSLHAALEREAKQEGVSLNQLVVAKLAAQLRTVVGG